MTHIAIEPIKSAVGATVHVDRTALTDDDVVQRIADALEQHSVLVFPRIGLSDTEQLALTDKLGGRVDYKRLFPNASFSIDDVYKVGFDVAKQERKEFVHGTFFWHIDGVMIDMPVQKFTLLSARKLSERGGQTEFCSVYAAYESLSQAEKDEVEGLRVLHGLEPSMKLIFDEPTDDQMAQWRRAQTVRPLVWTHASGRKSLVIGSSADRILDMPLPNGRALLARLIEWAAQPDFRYTHHWQDDDLVIWDNTGLMHRVIPYDESSGRTMHRTTVKGVELIA